MIVGTLTNGQLLPKVFERVKTVGGIEFLVVFSVAALHLSIVTRCIRFDQFVLDSEACKGVLEQGWFWIPAVCKAIGKLKSIVCLDALDRIRKPFYAVLNKHRGRVCAVFRKGFQIAKTTVFINEGVLIPFCAWFLPYDAYFRNIFHINLNSLSRILHLFIWFWNIFRIWELCRQLVAFAKEAVQTGDGSGVAALAKLDPEHDQTRVFVAPEHIQDQLDLLGCVLVRMAVWPMRAIRQRLKRSVVALEPAVDVLTVGFVVNSCFCDTVLLCVEN